MALNRFALSLLACVLVASPAFAQVGQEDPACAAMRATFAPKQAEIATLREKQAALARRMEAFRNRDADTLKQTEGPDYEGTERELARTDRGLQAAITQMQQDKAGYQMLCGGED
jgi:hypothetical protein